MSATQLALPVPAHRNQQLFSDHYLDVILPSRPDWAALARHAAPAMEAISAIVRGFHPSDHTNEAQTENDLVRPVLLALGHTFEVQPSLATPDGRKQPDYVLYRDEATARQNRGKLLDDVLLRNTAFAVADAKYWDRPLDVALRSGGRDVFTNRNPSYQIAFYMQHAGTDWGILTNGRLWRLYHKDTAHKLLRFYEVDLVALTESGDPARFLYFWLFFGRAAFDAEPMHGGPGVAAMLRASAEYARGVGDTLKVQVYDALHHLAQGFLDYTPNNLAADAPTLQAIYDNALIVLYRMLFGLYAEARDLLPLRESERYRQRYSFMAIKGDVADDLDGGMALLPDSGTLWPRLRDLWRIIDQGSPPLKVATFNGGLFDAARHPFLEQYVVGDGHLQQAIDKLARIDKEFVDYRDLDERHLGTIYEGLLEYHLHVAQDDTAATTPRVQLLNSKGERKATGSYYTPDYIVKYIVEQTVGPVLRRAVEDAPTDQAKLAAVLDVNVLDPAMGSGHFLVEVVEYIARFLVDLAVQPDADAGNEADLQYWKRRVAQSCVYGVDLNPLAVELAKLSLWLSTVAKDRPLSFLDHHLRTGNALVGARIGDLRVGNAPKRRSAKTAQQTAAGQLPLLDDDTFRRSMSAAVDSMWLIERSAGATVADVKEQERVYAELRQSLTRRYGRLADLVTATHFGLAVDPTFWHPLADYATGRTLAAPPRFEEWLAEADHIAAERRFFHWDLEFPEVFFDRHGQPLGDREGFDAVVGNPPYVRQEDLAPTKPFFAVAYPAIFYGTADLFVYFFGRGLDVLRRGGRLSYIASNSWLRANYATPLRGELRTNATVETLLDLGDNRVFADAPDVYPAIVVVRRDDPPAEHIAQAATFTRGEGLGQFASRVAAKLAPVAIHDQADSGWQLGNDAERMVFAKLMRGGTPFGEAVNGQLYYGIKTGLNEAFIVDQATRDRLVREDRNSTMFLKPLVNGEDIRSWVAENEGRWLILIPDKWTVNTFGPDTSESDGWQRLSQSYPAIAHHLSPFAEAAKKRSDKGSFWWELRPCSYYHLFEQEKILWPEMAKQPRFALVDAGIVGNKTSFMVPKTDGFLLGILMSRANWFSISKLCVPIGERGGMLRYTLSAQFMQRLPIPDASQEERHAIGALAMAITEQARARYEVHRRAQRRILADLGVPGKNLNQKLTAWWTLDWAAFRTEIQKVFRHDIPLRDRDDWEAWLDGRRTAHDQHTAEIVRLETELNARVYALFGLSPDEIAIVEASTRYGYGEV